LRHRERLTGGGVDGAATGYLLPALNRYVAIARIKLNQPRPPTRPSAAIMVVPEPPNKSITMSRLFDELRR
jgi:hypothetical protein